MNSKLKATIKSTDLDPNFKFEIARTHEGRSVLWCVQCGMCSSNCPYADILDPKLHQVIKMIQLGMRDQALDSESIWFCATCFMCAERCPQGVEVGNVMFAIKNIAAKEKGIPDGFKRFLRQVYESGKSTRITGLRNKERENLGLPELPKTDHKEIRELLKKFELDKLADLKNE
jgi:heterodisulfide reductase subunit C